jgi:hypothetical protein
VDIRTFSLACSARDETAHLLILVACPCRSIAGSSSKAVRSSGRSESRVVGVRNSRLAQIPIYDGFFELHVSQPDGGCWSWAGDSDELVHSTLSK